MEIFWPHKIESSIFFKYLTVKPVIDILGKKYEKQVI